MINEKDISKKHLTRRDFLICLGAGTSLAIAGFFTFNAIQPVADDQRKALTEMPKLADNIRKSFENGQMTLLGKNSKCFVNSTGERIIGLLDGQHTLSQVSALMSIDYSIEHTSALETSIATFICQLGASGYLDSPFYVTMYETY